MASTDVAMPAAAPAGPEGQQGRVRRFSLESLKVCVCVMLGFKGGWMGG